LSLGKPKKNIYVHLIDLNSGIDDADEDEAREEPQRPGDEEEGEGGDEHIAHVHHRRHRTRHLELALGIIQGVEENVEGAASRSEK